MSSNKAVIFFTVLFIGCLGGSSLLIQGCASASNPSGPTQATTLAATPTPVPNNTVFVVTNSSNTIGVWEIVVLDNSNGLSNYTYCSAPTGATTAVTVSLPSGSGSYQVTVNCNASGYCRKAVCNPVTLAVGTGCNITISPTGVVTVGPVTCPSLSAC